MKILLIDDDEFLRDMYAIKFIQNNYEVDVAEGASTALNKIKATPNFDLILLDMIMPGVSGAELIREIKKEFPNMETKFVILSNQGEPEDIQEAKDAGAVGYIIKAESVPSDVVKKVEELSKK